MLQRRGVTFFSRVAFLGVVFIMGLFLADLAFFISFLDPETKNIPSLAVLYFFLSSDFDGLGVFFSRDLYWFLPRYGKTFLTGLGFFGLFYFLKDYW